jgi:hypothetical protein
MHGFLAGAFDRFANAHALACELHSCGFDDANVRITGNPSNPDAVFGVSLSAEIARFPSLLQICFSNLFEFGDSPARGPSLDALREGGIVVSVCVTDRDEAEIARAAFFRHRALMLRGDESRFVPTYKSDIV